MKFDEPGVHERLDGMDDAALDDVPFGVIGLDAEMRVVAYNADESKKAGLSRDRVLGKPFFTEVAPCMNNFMVAQRFQDEPSLDAVVDYVLTLRMRPTKVRLRLLRAPAAKRSYVLVDRS